jgi:hypothetical protein
MIKDKGVRHNGETGKVVRQLLPTASGGTIKDPDFFGNPFFLGLTTEYRLNHFLKRTCSPSRRTA